MQSGAGWEGWFTPVLIALLSGLVATASFSPTGSKIPNTTAATIVEEQPKDNEPIHARAWEDPLLAVSRIDGGDNGAVEGPSNPKDASRASAATVTSQDGELVVERASLASIWDRSPRSEKLRILIQEMVAGPGLEDEESRRQERLACSSGLERSGFRVSSPALIRVRIERPLRAGISRLIAAQWYARGRSEACLVMYVPDGVLDDGQGLPRLRHLAEQVIDADPRQRKATVWIIRRNSQALIDDLYWLAWNEPAVGRASWGILNTGSTVDLGDITKAAKGMPMPRRVVSTGIRFVAGRLWFATDQIAQESTRASRFIEHWAATRKVWENGRDPAPSLKNNAASEFMTKDLRRILNSDTRLIDLLINELKFRRRVIEDSNMAMAVLCESDSPYGQAFASHFTGDDHKNVRVMNFSTGLDIAPRSEPGRRAYLQFREEAKNLRGAGLSLGPATPLGPRHLDYVYRQLEYYRRDLEERGQTLTAVFIGAYDQNDKRPLIQMVRENFPNALVMTTDLHSSLIDALDFEVMRNVIVASHLGLRVSQDVQAGYAPFRSCYQTAIFLASIYAGYCEPGGEISTDTGNDNVLDTLVKEMQRGAPAGKVYEIGRGRAFGLLVDDSATLLVAGGYYPMTLSRSVPWQMIGGAVLFTLGLVTVSVVMISFFARGGAQVGTRARDVWDHARRNGVRVLLPSLMCLLVAWLVIWRGDELGEPFGWYNGVSAWPSEIIRFTAIVLAGCFTLACWFKIRYGLVAVAVDPWAAARLDGGDADRGGKRKPALLRFVTWFLDLERLKRGDVLYRRKIYPNQKVGDHANISSKDRGRGNGAFRRLFARIEHSLVMGWVYPWTEGGICVRRVLLGLGIRTERKAVWSRLLVWGMIFGCIALGALLCFERPSVPVRGEWAYRVHVLLMILLALVLNVLVILVIDAGHLCHRFVTLLGLGRSRWPDDIKSLEINRTGIPGEIVDSWLDVQAVARMTGVVNRMIYLPIIVVLVSALAWHRGIDAWPLSPLVYTLYGMSLLMCVVVGWAMRRCAERVRRQEIEHLAAMAIGLEGGGGFGVKTPPGMPETSSVAESKPDQNQGNPTDIAALDFVTVVAGHGGENSVSILAAPTVSPVRLSTNPRGSKCLHASQVKSVIERIEAIREGAFAPWLEDPIVRGMVIPVMGVLAVKAGDLILSSGPRL